jgi:small-conductance mechanosensitive channel
VPIYDYTTNFCFSFLQLESGFELLKRIWSYIDHKFLIGNISVSLTSLVFGLIVFVVALFFSRTLSAVLDRRIAKRPNIDLGLRYTIVRLIKYLIITIGVLVALKQAFGLDLTSIAVVFTALSVGIGFGLQYLAADIASGFILLFERPIRVGDRITIGEDEGDVQSINLRTTIVNTNDRISIIVPNSKLVSQRVINWSYGDPRARLAIPVSVADDSDIDLVTQTLLDTAKDVEFVLDDPPPKVQFLRFGDYALDFRLLVWTRHPNRQAQIRSDINYRIKKLFKERLIEIPYPTQEFLLRGMDLSGGKGLRDLFSDESLGASQRQLQQERALRTGTD